MLDEKRLEWVANGLWLGDVVGVEVELKDEGGVLAAREGDVCSAAQLEERDVLLRAPNLVFISGESRQSQARGDMENNRHVIKKKISQTYIIKSGRSWNGFTYRA
jgi:hypothetical protein